MTFRQKLAPLAAVALVTVSACGERPPSDQQGGSGGGEHTPSHQTGGDKQAKPEQAFLQAMVPHHQSAIDMARVAKREGESSFVKELAGSITSAQEEEIGQMRKIHERLFRSPLRPDEGAHDALGLTAEEAGMNHMDGGAMLRGKRPFDRAFIDEMVPHHEGAIAMARVVLKETRDPELRKLADEIIRAQKREIAEMNAFREREYGGAAPSEATPSAHGEHGG
jgi:uncharacterized protein (DUF305 family)